MSTRPYDKLKYPTRVYTVKRGKFGGLYILGPRNIKLYLNSRAVPDDVKRANTHLYDDDGELREEAREWWLRKSRADAGCGRSSGPGSTASVDCTETKQALERARRTVDEVTRKADALTERVVELRSEVKELKIRATAVPRVKKTDCKETTQKLVAARRTASEATKRADDATRRIDEEKRRVGEETKRADEATRRVDQVTRRVDEATKRVGEEAKRVNDEKKRADELADKVGALRSEVKELKHAAAAAAPRPVSDKKLQKELVRAHKTVELMRREIEELKQSDAEARARRLGATVNDTTRVAALEKRVRDLDFEKERLLRANANTVRERNELKLHKEELATESKRALRDLVRARAEVETATTAANEQRAALQAAETKLQTLETRFSTQATDLVAAISERQRLSETLETERARNGRNSLQSRELRERVTALDEKVATYTSELERTHARLLVTASQRDTVQNQLDQAQLQLQVQTPPFPSLPPSPLPSRTTPLSPPRPTPSRPTTPSPKKPSIARTPGGQGAAEAERRVAEEERRERELELAREDEATRRSEAAAREAAAETRARLEREAIERRQQEEKARRELATRDLRDTAATGKVRVVARVRPLLPGEKAVGITRLLADYSRQTGTSAFDDAVYGASASDEFFRQYGFDLQLEQFLQTQTEAMIMLYGGSGAGKTYATKYLLKRAVAAANADPRVASVRLCFLDVYKSGRTVDVYDLLYRYNENHTSVEALPLADTTPYSSLNDEQRALVDRLRREAIPRASGRLVDTGPAWRSKNSCRIVARPSVLATMSEGKEERKHAGGRTSPSRAGAGAGGGGGGGGESSEAELTIGDAEAVDRLLDYAARLRIATLTRANRSGSSRSHLFIRVKVEFWDPVTHDPRGQASLYFLDLAGTEDYNQYTQLDFKKDRGIKTRLLSEADQKAFDQLKDESKFINSSLLSIEPIVRNAKTHVQGTSRFGPANTFAFERLLEDIITPATQLTVVGALTPNSGDFMTFIDPVTGKKREEHEYDVASANTLAFLTRLSTLTTKTA
jgi:hypothetical protein